MAKEKVMDLKDAISKFVKNGNMLCIANFLHSIPYAIIHEIIRQRKTNLTGVSCSSVDEFDLLLSGGCLSKIITSYYHRAGGIRYKRELDRALLHNRIELEEYSNFTLLSMLMAGSLGYSFMPVLRSIKESDIYRFRNFLGENKMKTINCPFTGKEIVVCPAINPDIAIVHVQRADKSGNAQFWGNLATVKWSVLSAKKIIVSCEEIVEHEKIKRSPFLTLIPSFRVNAVCEIPMGAHPSPVAGYYNHDIVFRSNYFRAAISKISNEKFLQEWILDRKDREDYLNHYIERFTREPLDLIKVNEFMSDSINMGYKQKYWVYNDRLHKDFCLKIAQTREEYNQKIEKYGELQI